MFIELSIILLLLMLVWIMYYESYVLQRPENYADITYNTNYDLQAGELIVAHASDDGTVKYYVVPTTPTMDYGFFKQKIDNHEYKFIVVSDPEEKLPQAFLGYTTVGISYSKYPDNHIRNVIPKVDIITGIPEYVSKDSEEYKLVYNLRFHPEKYRLLYSENDVDLAPYSITRKPSQLMQPVSDVFVQTLQ